MTVLIIVCSLLAVSTASPVLQNVEPQTRFLFYPNPMDAPIRHQEYELYPDGSYQWSYETGNGIVGQELSYFKKLPDSEEKVVNVQGSFFYVGDDGVQISLTYTADENGFHPEGAHLPTPPPTPDYILRALKYIAESSTSSNNIS